MKNMVKAAGGVLESSVPTLLLGCGLVALASLVDSVGVPAWRALGGVATLCLLALWWMLRKQERTLREMQQMLGCFREETMTRRSTMRFMFDELLDDSDNLRAQVLRTRHLLENALSTASGFLDLMDDELGFEQQTPARGYLKEVREAVTQCVVLAGGLGAKARPSDQLVGSPNSSTVSVLNRL